jgi:hypothetical protein
MTSIVYSFIIGFSILVTNINAQTLRTSNKPSPTSSSAGVETGSSVYGVFVGRTPCQEFLKELNMGERAACVKRKMGLTLYYDSVTHEPTMYKTRGMGKWSGQGKWRILRGTPADPMATVFQLELDPNTSLFLLKGDDNVLFILDRNKHFLTGNADHSYTLNRAMN